MSSVTSTVHSVKGNLLASVQVVLAYEGQTAVLPFEAAVRRMKRLVKEKVEGEAWVDGLMEVRSLEEALTFLEPRGSTVFGQRNAEEVEKIVRQRFERTGKWEHKPEDNDVKVGGYRSVLEGMLDGVRVGKLPLPSLGKDDSADLAAECIERVLDTSRVQAAYVDAGKLVVLAAAEKTGWCGAFRRHGLEVKDGGKAAKRLKVLMNRYLYTQVFQPKQFSIQVITDPVQEKRLDGAFLVRQSCVVEVIEGTEAASPEQKRRARGTRLGSGRVVVPVGTPAVEEGGLIKGNYVVVPDHLMPAGVDVVTHITNVKKEIRGARTWIVMFEPQVSGHEVRTNVQAMVNLKELFPEEQVKSWIDRHVRQVADQITSGALMDDFARLAELQKEHEEEGVDSHYLRIRYSALEFVKCGLTYWHSPSLVRRLYESHTKTIVEQKPTRAYGLVPSGVRVAVPFSKDMQVVSASLARLCSSQCEPRRGELLLDKVYGFAVVNDYDWLEMNPSHGGCDQDDHFMLFFRLVKGQKKVIVLRNPSSMGEYSVFDTQEEDTGWPTVNLGNAPMRLSEAIKEGAVKVVGLPRAQEQYRESYQLASVMREVRKALRVSLSPGKYVNADMLHALVFDEQREVLVDTMENVIDACTQGGSVAAVVAVRKEADRLVGEVLASGKPIDRTFWTSRQFTAPEGVEVTLADGWLTRLVEHAQARIKEMGEWLGRQAQARYVTPPQVIQVHAVSGPEKYALVKLLREWRRAAFELVDSGRAVDEDWRQLQAWLFQEVGAGRVGKFAFVCHTTRTRLGEVQEGCLWNEEFVRHYLDALKVEGREYEVAAQEELCF